MTSVPPLLPENLFSLKGKTALVTGGTSGIGLSIASGFVQSGASVYIVARNETDGDSVAAALSDRGKCRFIKGDLSSQEGIERVTADFALREERLDILINNAGLLEIAPIEQYEADIWDRALNINLKAAFYLSRALLPKLRNAATATQPARIVNIGSGHGLRAPHFDNFGYSAAKAGIHHLTLHLARALAEDHITVNAIAPGLFASRQTSGFDQQTVDRVLSIIPLHRYGRAEDAMAAALYLCSSSGSFLTGVILPVDGGRSLG